eukprot:symbB.v1.2.037750.t2/scaffold5529.1/size26123/2
MRSSCIGALVLGSMCSSIRTGPRPLQKLECFLQLDSVVLETTRRRMLLPHAFRGAPYATLIGILAYLNEEFSSDGGTEFNEHFMDMPGQILSKCGSFSNQCRSNGTAPKPRSQAALTSAWLDAGRVGRREIGSAHAARGLVRFATH